MADKQDLTPEGEIRPIEREAREELADARGDEPTLDGMRSELRGWGIGLIIIGVAQFLFPSWTRCGPSSWCPWVS